MCKSKDASLSCSSISFLACGSMPCQPAGCADFKVYSVIATVCKSGVIVSDFRSRGPKLRSDGAQHLEITEFHTSLQTRTSRHTSSKKRQSARNSKDLQFKRNTSHATVAYRCSIAYALRMSIIAIHALLPFKRSDVSCCHRRACTRIREGIIAETTCSDSHEIPPSQHAWVYCPSP